MYVRASVCVFMHACTYVDIHRSGDSVCVHVSLCVLAGGEDTQEMCQQNSTRGEVATYSWEPPGRLNR